MAKPILVGYDPRALDRAPVQFGVEVARLTGAPLVVVSVEVGHLLHSPEHLDEDLLADCSQPVKEMAAELTAAGTAVDCRKIQGTSAAGALHRAAEEEEAGLLVVGSSRRSEVGRVVAGSTAQRLLHGSPCPVAVAPLSWSGQGAPKSIGVAYVDSDDGREALRGGHALARRIGATLRVVTVVPHRERYHLETDPPIAPVVDKREVVDIEGEHRIEAEKQLRARVAELAGDVPVEAEALVGDPAEVLVDFSKGVDLLVCGSRGYGPARAVLLGSVSRDVMDEARCPVIVLPRGVEATLEALLAEAPGAAAPA
jgi:nucleotide-binding universal stress UspA family protein